MGERFAREVKHRDVPGFHGQGLTPGPEPDEVNAGHNEDEGLQGMALVHRIAGLGQSHKQIAGNEDDAEHQHTFVQPAGHAASQAGGRQSGFHLGSAGTAQFFWGAAGSSAGWVCGSKVL